MIIKDNQELIKVLNEVVYNKEKFAKFMNFLNKEEYQGLTLASLLQVFLDYKENSVFVSKERAEEILRRNKKNQLEELPTSKYYDYGTKEEKVLYDVGSVVGKNYNVLNSISDTEIEESNFIKAGMEITPAFKYMLYDRYENVFNNGLDNTKQYYLYSDYWERNVKNKSLRENFNKLNEIIKVKEDVYSQIDKFLEEKDTEQFDYEEITNKFTKQYFISKNKLNDLTYNDKKNSYIEIYDKTPFCLRVIGINSDSKIRISLDAIEHIDKHFNEVEKDEILKELPKMIANPTLILNGNKENSIVLLSNININNKNILIPLYYDKENGSVDIYNVSSLYEKDNIEFFIEKEFLRHNVLAYNAKKIELIREPNDRLYLPMGDDCSIYDDSITNSLENVKYVDRSKLISWKTDFFALKPVCYINQKEYEEYKNLDKNEIEKAINGKIIELKEHYVSIGKYIELSKIEEKSKTEKENDTMVKTHTKIQDFGEKIGGAKKDLWKTEGISIADLDNMNLQEMTKYVVKKNIIIKPNYNKLIKEGIPKEVVYFYKTIIDSIPTKPRYKTEKTIKDVNERFIKCVKKIEELMYECKNLEACKQFINIFTFQFLEPNSTFRTFFNKKEYVDINLDKVKKTCFKWKYCSDSMIREMERKGFGEETKEKKTTTSYKKKFKIEPLKEIKRIGGEEYIDRNAVGEDFLRDFRFKGGEFGNWVSEKERQENLNFAYNSFRDLSKALGIKDTDITFNGKLSIAFGSRGSGSALAHYEPLRKVINLTRMKGAGSLAHEYGHFLDNIICEVLNGEKAYTAFCSETCKNEYDKDFKFENKKDLREAFNELIDCMQKKEPTEEEKKAYIVEKLNEHRSIILNGYSNYYSNNDLYNEFEECFKQNTKEEGMKKLKEFFDKCSDICSSVGYNSFKNMFPKSVIEKKSDLKERINFYYNIKDNLDLGAIKTIETNYYKLAKEFDGKCSKMGFGYWGSNCEMFARAFACYVNDTLRDKYGITNNYLTGHCEYVAPQGEERKKINECFDKLMEVVKKYDLFKGQELNNELQNNELSNNELSNNEFEENELEV